MIHRELGYGCHGQLSGNGLAFGVKLIRQEQFGSDVVNLMTYNSKKFTFNCSQLGSKTCNVTRKHAK